MSDHVAESDVAGPRDPGVRGSNQSGMRMHNERLVLTLVREHRALSKSEIARITGLSAQTVSVIMRRLEDEGLLLRGEPIRGKVGQPSVPMRLNADGAYFLGLKVGRRSMDLVLGDFLGNILGRAGKTYPYPTPDQTLRFADESLGALVGRLPQQKRDRIAGLGIAMPFYLWNWAQTLGVPQEEMDAWRTTNLQADLAASLHMPVFMQNDGTAACGAELVFGPSGGPRDFLYFYVGYFIGGGVVLNGGIFSGHGNAGALGPLPVPDSDGAVRPLIDVASLYLLERSVNGAGFDASSMWETADGWRIPDDLTQAWIDKAALGIAHAIVTACSIIDFECIKIDGWLPEPVRQQLIDRTKSSLAQINTTGLERPRIEAGNVGPDARALGATSLPLSEKYLIET
ncbi:MAG: ROK family transcriptional regulator [Pseudomonadota bacterium]